MIKQAKKLIECADILLEMKITMTNYENETENLKKFVYKQSYNNKLKELKKLLKESNDFIQNVYCEIR